MTVILPMIGILAVTSEWSQRSGLTTFTLVPHRGRVLGAKFLAAVTVGVVAMFIALVVGVLGTLVGSAIAGVDPVWNVSAAHFALIVLGSVLGMLFGFMLGLVIRNSAGAIVTYFVYTLVLPPLLGLLAANQQWFADLQPWVDYNVRAAASVRRQLVEPAVAASRRLRRAVVPPAHGVRAGRRPPRRGQVSRRLRQVGVHGIASPLGLTAGGAETAPDLRISGSGAVSRWCQAGSAHCTV